MTKKTVVDSLTVILASVYGIYLKTQNYHWNVTGPSFQSLHSLFEAQYMMLREDADTIAERIRALGPKVPATFTQFDQHNLCKDGDHDADSVAMLKDLASDYDLILEHLEAALHLATNTEDDATANLMSELISAYEKARWMIQSSI